MAGPAPLPVRTLGRFGGLLGAWLLSLVWSALGCTPIVYECASDESCGPRGVCESAGYCSFPDEACSSGRRFGGYAGGISSQCVPPSDPQPADEPHDIPSQDTAADEPGGSTGGSGEPPPPDDDDGPVDPSTTTGAASSSGDATTGGVDPRGTGSSSGDDSTTTGPADAGSSSTTGEPPPPPPSCTEIFAPLSDPFELCMETDTACRFGAQTNEGTCDTLCQAAGATCLHAWDNIDDQNQCVIDPVAADDCSIGLGFQICECTRPDA